MYLPCTKRQAGFTLVELIIVIVALGVLTAYAAAPQAFTEDQSRQVEMMAPHLGRIVGAALRTEQRKRESQEPRVTGARDLRIVYSR